MQCTVRLSVQPASQGGVTSTQIPPASALTSAEAVLAWAGLNTQGRERGEGGREEGGDPDYHVNLEPAGATIRRNTLG